MLRDEQVSARALESHAQKTRQSWSVLLHDRSHLYLHLPSPNRLLACGIVNPVRRMTAVQLVDAHLCTDPSKYLAALLSSLATMLHIELPQVRHAIPRLPWSCMFGPTSTVAVLHDGSWPMDSSLHVFAIYSLFFYE